MLQPPPRVYLQEFEAVSGQPYSFQMVEVKGGTFQMGSEDENAYSNESPIHSVKLSDFWMGAYLVTQSLWKAVMGEEQLPFYFQEDKRPAECISWDVVNFEFLPRLRKMTGENYRLPTEAEWEYSARGGIHQSTYQYAGSNRLEDVGWFWGNNHRETKPVGLKKPNALGIYDLSGNVYEWCADWYSGSSYYQQCKDEGMVENPTGPEKGSCRVVRSSYSIYRYSRYNRISLRGKRDPLDGIDLVGFRLVVSVLQSAGWEKRLKTHEQKRKIR